MNRDVGVVVLGLGERSHAVHEREGIDERGELERALECAVDLCPAFGNHDGSIYDRFVMTVSSESAPTTPTGRRAGRELLLELVFRPLSSAFVPLLQRAKVPPPAVVFANAVAGLVAALAIAGGELIGAAVLLQLKTLLDNMDGQLARASARVTLSGRYLDTIADLVVNAAVFAALGYVTAQPLLATTGFVALTLVLAFDFNVTELYREQHGASTVQPPPSGSRSERLLSSVYRATLAPLDRFVRGLVTRRFDGHPSYDRFTVTVLANLGLTTQLGVLGFLLVLGTPGAYLWFVLAALAALVPLQLRAERRARLAVAR